MKSLAERFLDSGLMQTYRAFRCDHLKSRIRFYWDIISNEYGNGYDNWKYFKNKYHTWEFNKIIFNDGSEIKLLKRTVHKGTAYAYTGDKRYVWKWEDKWEWEAKVKLRYN